MYELGAGILPNSICVPLTATARAQALYFYPVLCGHYYCDSQYQVSRPCYENPLLLFVRSGSMALEYDGETYHAEKGRTPIAQRAAQNFYICILTAAMPMIWCAPLRRKVRLCSGKKIC